MKKIVSIQIKNSPFFEDIKIDFSDKLNCIMGGRGTGKSTLLYLIKSAIVPGAEENKIIYAILKNNLDPGEITVEIESEDGNLYKISKTLLDEPHPYKFPDQTNIPLEKISEEISCDIYETGKIEEIGRSEKDRLFLIDKKVGNKIGGFLNDISLLQIELESNAQDIKSLNHRLRGIDDFISQFEDVEDEFTKHKSNPPASLKEEEKREFEEADFKEKVRSREKRFFQKNYQRFSEFNSNTTTTIKGLEDAYRESIGVKGEYSNREIMNEAIAISDELISDLKNDVQKIVSKVTAYLNNLNNLNLTINERHDLQQAEFVKLKQKFESNREYINKYNTLSKRLNERATLLNDKKEITDKVGQLKVQRLSLIDRLNKAKQYIFEERLKAVTALNDEFEGSIVISLIPSGITDIYEEMLRNALKGSGMRYNELIPKIVSSFPTDIFAKIIHDKDIERLKTISGIDDARAQSLLTALYGTEDIYEIEGLYCQDLPEFKLRIHGDDFLQENYRRTEELSMGQRCTTVLPIIFAVSDNPLIIDQPEDNLDNKYVTEKIHEIIKHQKESRQLIFITHNPNIPVLSDAEQNVFLTYDRKANVLTHGDINSVKDEIVTLLEGGKKAFEKRRETYGIN